MGGCTGYGVSMSTCVITGANRGIGLELVKQLAARGEDVIALCREPSAELEGLGIRVEAGIDVTDAASTRTLADRLKGQPVDLLVNNAGILEITRLPDLDFDLMKREFDVNALGPLRVTAALLDNLHAGSKIALITSRMGSIADNGSGGAYGYRMSKAALNMAGVSLARDLRGRGIAVVILHPGMVATDMTARFGHGPSSVKPADAAANLIARIDELTLERTGEFRHANGEPLPW